MSPKISNYYNKLSNISRAYTIYNNTMIKLYAMRLFLVRTFK